MLDGETHRGTEKGDGLGMKKPDEIITYGYTRDLSTPPVSWFNSYQEAVECAIIDQPRFRPYYIIERCEHFEVCGIVDEIQVRK